LTLDGNDAPSSASVGGNRISYPNHHHHGVATHIKRAAATIHSLSKFTNADYRTRMRRIIVIGVMPTAPSECAYRRAADLASASSSTVVIIK
jgi:hypothetical protein